MRTITFKSDFGAEKPMDMNAAFAWLEREFITGALEETGGVKARAAQLLGLNRTTFIEKMRRYKMPLKASSRK